MCDEREICTRDMRGSEATRYNMASIYGTSAMRRKAPRHFDQASLGKTLNIGVDLAL
jgi:hypothetical protein